MEGSCVGGGEQGKVGRDLITQWKGKEPLLFASQGEQLPVIQLESS